MLNRRFEAPRGISTFFYAAVFTFMMMFSIGVTMLRAQACSCPVNNGCFGESSGPGSGCPPADVTAGGDHGSDPICFYKNPDPCLYPANHGCTGGSFWDGSCCVRVSSPIILDLEGVGFHLSDANDGVLFRPFPMIASQYKVAWPEKGSHNGWLVLDRNGNGVIDDFGEMFGNETPQPDPAPGKARNGFAALAVYDALEQGGNGDGWISKEDAIYTKLRVWVDENRDGISQPSELHTLDSLGIAAIDLKYEESRRRDAYGNLFRYRSHIRDAAGGETSKIIYDVYLLLGDEHVPASPTAWPQQMAPVGFVQTSQPSKP
jgi:hypothetical protein